MKIKRLLACIVLLSALTAMAENYFTMGENDTLLIRPTTDIERYETILVSAHFDGRLDYWQVNFNVPSEFEYVSMGARSGMTISYVTATGDSTTLDAVLTHNTLDGLSASSYITTIGFWDYNEDGIYESYGTVKWEAGDCSPMFAITFRIPSSFNSGVITLSGVLNSGSDNRGGTLLDPPVHFTRTITVKVGYRRGDVNGDEHVSMDDITALINYLAGIIDLDAYQLEAADMNGNGTVNLDDLTILINYLVYNQGMSLDELNEVLNGGTQSS